MYIMMLTESQSSVLLVHNIPLYNALVKTMVYRIIFILTLYLVSNIISYLYTWPQYK